MFGVVYMESGTRVRTAFADEAGLFEVRNWGNGRNLMTVNRDEAGRDL